MVEGPALTKPPLSKGPPPSVASPEGQGPPCETAWDPLGGGGEGRGVASSDKGPPVHFHVVAAIPVCPALVPSPSCPRDLSSECLPWRPRGAGVPEPPRGQPAGSEAGLDRMHSSKHPSDDGLRRQREGAEAAAAQETPSGEVEAHVGAVGRPGALVTMWPSPHRLHTVGSRCARPSAFKVKLFPFL